MDFSQRGVEAKKRSDLAAHKGGGRMMTQQHFTEEVDINTIVRRFGLTGAFPGNVAAGVYGDFSGISDYDSALQTISAVQDRFMQLPADLREQFNNDPGRLVRFASEHSEEELERMFAPPPPSGSSENPPPA